MSNQFLTSSEIALIEKCLEVQMDIAQTHIEEFLDEGVQVFPVVDSAAVSQLVALRNAANEYFNLKNLVDKIKSAAYDFKEVVFTREEYNLMVAPLELHVEMGVDGIDGVVDGDTDSYACSLYRAASALGKIKLFFQLPK